MALSSQDPPRTLLEGEGGCGLPRLGHAGSPLLGGWGSILGLPLNPFVPPPPLPQDPSPTVLGQGPPPAPPAAPKPPSSSVTSAAWRGGLRGGPAPTPPFPGGEPKPAPCVRSTSPASRVSWSRVGWGWGVYWGKAISRDQSEHPPPPPPPPAGILDEFLQAYGSLIPVSADEVVEKLEDIFQQEFSTPQRWGGGAGGAFGGGGGAGLDV